MHDRIFNLLVEQNEISWRSMIFDLVKKEGLDPWNIDISKLAEKYIKKIKTLKQANLKVSGKVVLAASILLRIKSTKLVGDDLDEFDRLIAGDVNEEEFYDDLARELARGEEIPKEAINYELLPRLPQPRKRKVSVFDLVNALEKALEVKQRRVLRNIKPNIKAPEKGFDINKAISNLNLRINSLINTKNQLTFSDLLSDSSKDELILTLLPLLHLSNEGNFDLKQDIHFGDIFISRGGKNAD